VVGVALVPTAGSLSVLRALRIVRVLRLISTVPAMRRVVGALFSAIPGMGTIAALLGLLFYVFAVMATNLFGAAFPDWFGTLGRSAYSLFQVMTLESWSMGIVRPVMVTYPLAWAFFLPFILVTSFAVLNLFIGIIVDAMQTHHRDTEPVPANRPPAPATGSEDDRAVQLAELRALRAQVATLDARLAERRPGPEAQRAGRPGPAHGRACQTVHT
jgi:voltage-gated sodium channel